MPKSSMALLTTAAAAVAAWSLYRFIAGIRRERIVTDTPLVRIRSAAQGYVKVAGRIKAAEGGLETAPLSSQACVWWSYRVEQRHDSGRDKDNWRTIDSASSITPFLLADTDAECLVGPVNAEITPTEKNVWYGNVPRPRSMGMSLPSSEADFRYTESRLCAGDALTVVGELRSQSNVVDRQEAARGLLAAWKKDQSALLSRFDTNGDGKIDGAEWESARQAAANTALVAPVTRCSVIAQPIHGEPFLIAPLEPEHLARRERLRAALFLALGLGAASLCAWGLGTLGG